jgi:hypothetical protein
MTIEILSKKPNKLEAFIDKFNASEKNERNHIKLNYYGRFHPLHDYASNGKGDRTYNSPSSCIGNLFLKSNIFNEFNKEEIADMIFKNMENLSEIKQTQLFDLMYKNHKDYLFYYAQHSNNYYKELKRYPYNSMNDSDYIEFMNICLKTLSHSLSDVDTQQSFLKIINNKKINKEQFFLDYPKLSVKEGNAIDIIEDEIQTLNIKLDVKKLFLFNLQKTFGYGKFREVLESFFEQFKSRKEFSNVIISFDSYSEDSDYLRVLLCAKEINKPVWKKTIALHLEQILTQNKLNLAQEKIVYVPAIYEKALIDHNLGVSESKFESKSNKTRMKI